MSYLNGRQYSNFRGINLLAANGALRFEDVDVAPTTTSGEYVMYVDGGVLYWDNGSTITALGAAGGSGGASWEAMYASDNTINIAGGNGLTIAGAMSNANNVLTITQTSDGSGHALQITNTGTGKDINGSSDLWSITKAGVIDGVGLTITASANSDTVVFTNNSVTSNNLLMVTGSGTHTGTGANSFANVTASGLTTGTALTVIANAATTSVGVFDVSATGMTSGSTVRVTGGGANITSGGKVLEVAMGAATTGAGVSVTTSGTHQGTTTDSCVVINSAGDTGTLLYLVDNSLTTGVAQLITSSGTMTTTGSLLTLTANSATTAAGIFRINANGLTSGIGAVIASSATAITGAGRLLRVDHTGATGGTAILSEFASAANDETVILKVTASDALALGTAFQVVGNSITTGNGITVAVNGLTDGYGIGISSSATAITSTGHLLFVNHTGVTGTSAVLSQFTSAATDETVVVGVTLNSAITTVGVKIADSGTGMTSGSLLRISTGTTGAVATNGIVSITATGAYTSTSNCGLLQVVADSITTGATVVNISMTAATTSVGLRVISSGTGLTSGSLALFSTGTTGAIATNGAVSIVGTGAFTSTSRAGLLNVVANSTTGGTIAHVSGTSVTDGTLLSLEAVEATLTTGLYIQCYDGAANDFSVARYGATVIAGNAALTASLTLTKGDFLMSDGVFRGAVTATITADVGSIQGGSPLTRSFNEIAVSGVSGDSVTLPAAAAGQFILVTNHGANSADVFPASGDAINEGSANAAKSLAADASMMCYSYDATNWECLTLAR